jgi:hypothetical protein
MADNPPQNREQRRAAKYGRHRTDVHDAHDPWPTSQPNPALGDAAVAGPADEDPTDLTGTDAGAAGKPDAQTPGDEGDEAKTTPKG